MLIGYARLQHVLKSEVSLRYLFDCYLINVTKSLNVHVYQRHASFSPVEIFVESYGKSIENSVCFPMSILLLLSWLVLIINYSSPH